MTIMALKRVVVIKGAFIHINTSTFPGDVGRHKGFHPSRTWGMVVRTVEVKSAISILDAHASGRLNLNCNSCLKEKRVRTGIHVVRTVASIFP